MGLRLKHCRCGRVIVSNRSGRVRCRCGLTVAVSRGTPMDGARSVTDRPHRRTADECDRLIAICRSGRCGHWGTDDHGRTGCLMHPRCPRRIDEHLALGGGCLSTPPLFDAEAEATPPSQAGAPGEAPA